MKLHKLLCFGAMLSTLTFNAKAQSVTVARDTIVDPYAVYPETRDADYHALRQSWYFNNYIALSGNDDTEYPMTMPDDDEIIARLQSIETDMELPYNSSVRYFIHKYCNDWRRSVENMLAVSLYYMPIFEQALIDEGIPVEFKYLPIIESAMKPTVQSRAKATGLWQFMYDTAKGMGITINTLVDERCDPEISSRAAAKFLHRLHDMYDDWALALAAYNWGPGNVNKAIARYSGNQKPDYWALRQYMPDETRNYVPKFIAVVYVMNFFDKHNISPVLASQPIIVDSVHVSRRVHFNQISEVLDIPVEVIRALNPQYIKDIIPGDGTHHYTLKLPSYQTLCYVMSEDSIVAHNAHLYNRRDVIDDTPDKSISSDGKWITTTETKWYKVRRGDTWAKIAKKYGVTVKSLQKLNGKGKLMAGRTIKIETQKRVLAPQDAEEPAANVTPETQSESSDSVATEQPEAIEEVEIETVEAQEAEEIVPPASEPAVETPKTVENERTVVTPQPTQPKAGKTTPSEPKPEYYTVKKGDNLGKIATRYKTTVAKLQKLNNLKNDKIQIGQRLRVK